MTDSSHLEKMGRELKCPICLSLLKSAVSLTCNHIFCEPCIAKSMKTGSSCPVCKVPYSRREVRPAPHMDNLVTIYKSMETASGVNIFVTQPASPKEKSDRNVQGDSASDLAGQKARRSYQRKSKKLSNDQLDRAEEEKKSDLRISDSQTSGKPSFPANKRVQVPPLAGTSAKSEGPIDILQKEPKECAGKDVKDSSNALSEEDLRLDGNGDPLFCPFFWLKEMDENEETSEAHSCPTDDDCATGTPQRIIPSFSDIKDSQSPTNTTTRRQQEENFKVDMYESEMFQWTQRACSPELCSTPTKEPGDKNKQKKDVVVQLQSDQPIKRIEFSIKPHKQMVNRSARKPARTSRTKSKMLKSNARHTSVDEVNTSNVVTNDTAAELKDQSREFPNISRVESKNSYQGNGDVGRVTAGRKRAKKAAGLSKGKRGKVSVNQRGDFPEDAQGQISSKEPSEAKLRQTGSSSMHCKGNEAMISVTEAENSNGGMGCTRDDKTFDIGQGRRKRGPKSESHKKRRYIEFSINPSEEIAEDDIMRKRTRRQAKGTDPRAAGNNENLCTNTCQEDMLNSIGTLVGSKILRELATDATGKIMDVKLPSMPTATTEIDASLGLRNGVDRRRRKHNSHLERSRSGSKNPSGKVEAMDKSIVSDVFDGNLTFAAENKGNYTLPSIHGRGKWLSAAKSRLLQKCEQASTEIRCAFCGSCGASESTGEIVHYFRGQPVAADYNGGSRVIHSHKKCAEWAPNVYFEEENAINLEAELARSKRIKCSCCRSKGAALGCYDQSCRKSFHVPCAKMILQCRWDEENFVMLCPSHSTVKLPKETVEKPKQNRKPLRPKLEKQDQASRCWKWPSGSPQKWVLCCSALSAVEKESVSKLVKVAGIVLARTWTPTVTHVIASTNENGECKRTLKFLMGILEGKWVLKIDWVEACLMAMEPVAEQKHEIQVDIHRIRGGPQRGRHRIMNKEPKLFNGLQFYFAGEFTPSYKGYLHDLVTAGGGVVLQRKPISRKQGGLWDESSKLLYIIYSLEIPEKIDLKKTSSIFDRRRIDAYALSNAINALVAPHSWILDSIAASKLQVLDDNVPNH